MAVGPHKLVPGQELKSSSLKEDTNPFLGIRGTLGIVGLAIGIMVAKRSGTVAKVLVS